MRTLLTLLVALTLTGCPEKKSPPSTPVAPAKVPEKKAPSTQRIAGCYQWQGEGEDPQQLRIVPEGDGFTGTYLGWMGPDFVAWFRVDLKDLSVKNDTVLFTFGTRNLWGDVFGMDDDLSGKRSDGFTRTGWAFEGKLGEKGITFTCVAEGVPEQCWTRSGLFERVDARLCGPAPKLH